MPNKSVEDLNTLYFEAENADQEILAEQRSNILLVAGVHYNKKGSRYWSRIRSAKELSSETKLRLTKNHIQKITKTYVNGLITTNPSVKVLPRNESEAGDRKSASINDSVWQFAEEENDLKIKYADFAKDLVEAGECFVKVFWNPDAGKLMGYEKLKDPEGFDIIDEETGQPKDDKDKAVFQGKIEIEGIFPSNVLRDPNSTEMRTSRYLIVRKMVDIDTAKSMAGDDPIKQKFIVEDSKDEFMVFDGKQDGLSRTKDQTMLREFYFRPSKEYPNGYYFIATRHGILHEGELPFGEFPIHYVGWDNIQTSPRHRSIIKQLRPYQMEINRTASKIAEHQVTSDDKILIQSGTKLSSGGILPGIRGIQYSGMAPTVLAGRAGDQYLPYLNSQIGEMYNIAMLAEEKEGKQKGDGNPWSSLFQNIADKKKFVIYTNKFEHFLARICTSYLRLAQQYFDEEMLIPAIDRNDYVNIPEFKNTDPLNFRIKVVPMSDDINTMYGKTMLANHVMQYSSASLEKEEMGHMLRQLPFSNGDQMFKGLTLNADSVENMILALERGETPAPNIHDDNPYMIKHLVYRQRQSDFKLLDPNIQKKFELLIEIYENQEKEKQMQIQRAQAGFIPSGGALVKTDLQVTVPNSTGGAKTTRAVFPIEALEWLNKQLEIQGSTQENLRSLGTGAQAQISGMVNSEGSVRPRTQGPLSNQGQGQPGSRPTPMPPQAL